MLGRLALRSRALAQHRNRFRESNGVRNYWWSKPIPLTEADQTTATAPEVLPADGLSELTSAIPPLQYGDFAALGLTSWWPSGIISWSFELLQVSTGMPWFHTIIAGTLFWRGILVPSALASLRNAALLSPYTERIKALDEQAKNVKDRAAQMELMVKKQKLMESAGVSASSMILSPIVQVVGNFGLFFAVKGMMQLPVAQLTQSGVWFLQDLTLTGGYVMPSIVLLFMNLQFSFIKRELDPTKMTMAHAINAMRVGLWLTLPFMSWMPAGMWLSVITGLMLSIAQSAVLKVPRIRQALSIAPVKPMPPVTMRDTGRMILEAYRRRMGEAFASQATNQRRPNWTTLPKTSRRH